MGVAALAGRRRAGRRGLRLLGRFVGMGPGYVTLVISGIVFLSRVYAVVQAPGPGLREERSRGSLGAGRAWLPCRSRSWDCCSSPWPAGLFLAAASLQSRAATAAGSFFALAIAMTAGAYYPRTALPQWPRIVSELSPFTSALGGLRAALSHGGHLGRCQCRSPSGRRRCSEWPGRP